MTKTESRKAALVYTKALNENRVVRLGYGATFKIFATADEANKAVIKYRAEGMPANVVDAP